MKRLSLVIVASVLATFAVAAAVAGSQPHAGAVLGLVSMPSPHSFDQLALLGFGGLIVNKGNLTILNQAFNGAFKNGFQTVTPQWNRVATPVPSSTGEEKYGWLGKTTKFREWLGDRVYQNLKLHDYTIRNKHFENTVSVDADDIADDKYGVYNMPMQMLGEDAALHPDELVFKLLAQGDSTKC